MASSISGSNSSNSGDVNHHQSRTALPSLFTSSSSSVASGKDMDSFINSINDNALSQQIEFILQETSMERDEDALSAAAGRHLIENPIIIKQESPPTPLGNDASLFNHCSSNSQEDVIMPITSSAASHLDQNHHIQSLLNGRPLIIQTTDNINPLLHRSVMEMHEEEEDPELNDENLQDIEEEAKAAEADEEPEQLQTQIKIEAADEDSLEPNDNLRTFFTTPSHHQLHQQLPSLHHHSHIQHHGHIGSSTILQTQPAQLVLPAGSIVSTTTRSLPVPVSEALAQLQRRPVYISNEGVNGLSGTTTYVRMPAVISRSPMRVLNVVHDSYQNSNNASNNNNLQPQQQIMLQSNSVISTIVNPNTNTTNHIIVNSANSSNHHQHQQNVINNNINRQQQATTISHNIFNTTDDIMNITQPTVSSSPPLLAPISNHINHHNGNHQLTSSINSNMIQSPNSSVSDDTTLGAIQTPIKNNEESNPAASIIIKATSISSKSSNTSSTPNLGNSSNSASSSPTAQTSDSSQTQSPTSYQCMECAEKFDNKELYEIHRSGHANNMKCAICNMVLKSLKNYEKHCLRCKPYECQICGRVVRFRPNFIKHMRVHTGQQSERHKYKCDVCQKEFMSFEYFKVHKKIHNENVNLTCEICGKVFSALASLRGHSKLHSGVKLHKCEVCGKGFGQRYNLKIHARTHTGDFPFECKICNKKLHTQSSLQTHLQTHQKEQNASTSKSSAASSSATSNISNNSTSSTASPSAIIRSPSQIIVTGGGTAKKTDNGVRLTSTSVTSSPLNVIIKQEPLNDNEIPSTSGLQKHLTAAPSSQQTQIPRQKTNITNSATTNSNKKLGIIREANNGNGKRKANNLSVLSKVKAQHQRHYSSMKNAKIINSENNKNKNSSSATVQVKVAASAMSTSASEPQIVESSPQVNRTIVIKSFTQNHGTVELQEQAQMTSQQQQQQPQRQIVQRSSTSSLSTNTAYQRQQQLLRKTPIIHSTSSSVLGNTIVQQAGVTKTNLIDGLSGYNNKIIRVSTAASVESLNNDEHQHQEGILIEQEAVSSQPQKSKINQRNHHRRRQFADVDDEDGENDEHNKLLSTSHLAEENNMNDSISNNHQKEEEEEQLQKQQQQIHQTLLAQHSLQHSHHRFEDDDDFDDKSSPSLATTAIKIEPTFYSSGSGDNSTDMLIKEEVIFEDSINNHSERSHSPPSSKYRMTNFDHDLVDHHVDLNHSLPPYGSLFEPHSIPVQLYPDDDDDFHLDHSSLGGVLHNASNNSSNADNDFIKKEWIYDPGSSYKINGKFDEDSDALCEAANFIYQ